MFRKVAFAVAALSVLGVAACAPTTTYQGFQAIDSNPADVKVGDDTRSTVLAKLGTPTATSTFDKDTWYYMDQVVNRTSFYNPRMSRRDVVAISFDKNSEQVVDVRKYGLEDGKVFAYNRRETPTRGREMTVLEQLLGSIGASGVLPPDQNQTPGSHPGDRP
ncbi:outer membrane protein assembly factor BamE [Caulobacter sp. KR2-114]|uniref:outer membrane protein assembly factor BamE n=1 Tax=Caulobacter sp. KR2-114 TaxID=3400912 RepID=UPI003C0E6A4D